MDGNDVKRIRKQLGVTQIELATRLGYGTATIKRVETGNELPSSLEKVLSVIDRHPEVFGYFLDEESDEKIDKEQRLEDEKFDEKTDKELQLELLQKRVEELESRLTSIRLLSDFR